MTTENQELEIIPPNSLEAITRGEIDIQIATAHRYPRSMAQFKKRAVEMATLDEDTAASCLYSRPVGNGKFAEGMSVRMAEIVGASYGNLRVGAMIISQTERQVVCRGFAHDLETNFASTSEVVEATIKKDGKPYDERMRVVIAKACLSKARRDATFQVVPKALCKPVESECRRVAIGDASTIAKRRGMVLTWISKLGIDVARVWKALNIAGEEDLGIDELTTLTGLKTAIKDGEVSIDEAFPSGEAPKGRVAEPPKRNAPAKDAPAEEKIPMGDAEEKKPAPKATTLQGIQNLCKASAVKECDLLEYLKSQGACDKLAQTLADISNDNLTHAISNWESILAGMSANDVPTDTEKPSTIEPTAQGILAAALAMELEQSQVVKWAVEKKWCDAKAKRLSELNPSALTKIAASLEASKDEIARG